MKVLEQIRARAQNNLKTIVFPEAEDLRILKAVEICQKNKYVIPVLVGNPENINKVAKENGVNIAGLQIVDPANDVNKNKYVEEYFNLRKSKGMDEATAAKTMSDPLYYAAMMVRKGLAGASVAGAVNTTGNVLRAAIQIIGVDKNYSIVSSTFLMVLPDGRAFTYGDCGVVPDPDSAQLADIAIASAETHKLLTGQDPIIALLSFSTKGSAQHPDVDKVRKAVEIAQAKRPDLLLDGELQGDAALVESVGQKKAPGSKVAGHANVLIFPDLGAGNIAYKLTERLANAVALGPLLQGLAHPANDLSRGCKAEDIVDVACICSLRSS
ncbi:MAG TPA: phosphate acetyltransferase [bacterium]|nr:phosphate acetyltransferase [bacterium]HPN42560.1 phosphate acetyltransferase [bacterium]